MLSTTKTVGAWVIWSRADCQTGSSKCRRARWMPAADSCLGCAIICRSLLSSERFVKTFRGNRGFGTTNTLGPARKVKLSRESPELTLRVHARNCESGESRQWTHHFARGQVHFPPLRNAGRHRRGKKYYPELLDRSRL